MKKAAALFTLGLLLAPSLFSQSAWQTACISRCMAHTQGPDPDLQRQEVVNLEYEAARSIQHSNGTFFRRVYSEDFVGTSSHGQMMNKIAFINGVESTAFKYDSFTASDIKVRIFQDMSIATCLWTIRGYTEGRHFSSQLRVVHVYLSSPDGWRAVSSQATALPPNADQPF
jgi:ketosteroid isomerase-like protein